MPFSEKTGTPGIGGATCLPPVGGTERSVDEYSSLCQCRLNSQYLIPLVQPTRCCSVAMRPTFVIVNLVGALGLLSHAAVWPRPARQAVAPPRLAVPHALTVVVAAFGAAVCNTTAALPYGTQASSGSLMELHSPWPGSVHTLFYSLVYPGEAGSGKKPPKRKDKEKKT